MSNVYLVDDVTVLRRTLDEWGAPGAATKVGYKGRIERKTVKVRDSTGELVVASGYVILPATADVSVSDRIALVSSTGSIDPEEEHDIISVEIMRDFSTRSTRVYIE